MPAEILAFRATCGLFLPVFMDFMRKRAVQNMKMRIVVLSCHNRMQGILCGFLISYMFWGSLLLMRCGDVESNPGPLGREKSASRDKSSFRQTTLSQIDDRMGGGKDDDKYLSSQDLSLVDVMTKLWVWTSR